jgi:carbon storage regulator
MLVLCRRTSESLLIGDEVTVTVLAVKGNQVRFGIAAPRDVTVDRQEVWERKQEQEGGAPAAEAATAPDASDAPPAARMRNRRKRRTLAISALPLVETKPY